MGSQFTPGPWSVDPEAEFSVDGDDGDGLIASGWQVVTSDEHAGFAAIVVDMNFANSWDGERTDANARLIAAAPDLYAALEEFSREYDGFENGDGEPCPTLAKARAALSRASLVQEKG